MTLSVLFWMLMILWLAFALWRDYVPGQPFFRGFVGNVLIFVLLGILGWQVFGPAIHR